MRKVLLVALGCLFSFGLVVPASQVHACGGGPFCDPIAGCPDPDLSGQARSGWMDQTMSDLLSQL
jgi:hypothetical protein